MKEATQIIHGPINENFTTELNYILSDVYKDGKGGKESSAIISTKVSMLGEEGSLNCGGHREGRVRSGVLGMFYFLT